MLHSNTACSGFLKWRVLDKKTGCDFDAICVWEASERPVN